MNCGGVWNKI